MFTGIVEEIGTVRTVDGVDGGLAIRIAASTVTKDLVVGASVAVDGACLTAVTVDPGWFSVEAVPETTSRTTLGAVSPGTPVNLERAMGATSRFDGHIVQGHVDGVGQVIDVRAEGDGRRMTVRAPDTVSEYLVPKGSVTVDGISLTVAGVVDDTFEVALIPHTLAVTTIGGRVAGDSVNLEADILAKYVRRLMAR